MGEPTFGMNVTLDGYIAAPGDDLGWSGGEGPDSSPSDELFQWWSDRGEARGVAVCGRKRWDARGPRRAPPAAGRERRAGGGRRHPPPARPRPAPAPPAGRQLTPPAAGGTCRRW